MGGGLFTLSLPFVRSRKMAALVDGDDVHLFSRFVGWLKGDNYLLGLSVVRLGRP